MTLENKIIKIIEKNSFISLEEFMQVSLHDKDFGYYRSSKPIGLQGDFITSPEISQLYGEMVGLWLSQIIVTNNIVKCNLIELGPGNGTLMTDIVRVIRKVLKNQPSIKIHFLENNIHFIKKLREQFNNATFHSDIETIPDEFSIYIANEFFDALPITQLKKTKDKLTNLVIKKDCNGKLQQEFMEDKNVIQNKDLLDVELKDGDIYEYSKQLNNIIQIIADRLKQFGGFIYFADYGYTKLNYKSTLSSMKNNKVTNFLDNIGKQDLTAHVNFQNINKILNDYGFDNSKIVKQSKFLKEIGIELRAEKLIEANPQREKEILSGLNRLIGLDEMGSLFKIIYSEYK
jgi:NADH dehydrogenase [ubiquinone] 1 alpha subcomplex assembly factor 7